MASTTQKYLIGGVVLVGILLLISERNSQSTNGGGDTSGTTGAGPCTVRITADVLNVRSSPDGNATVVDTYVKDEVTSADRVTRNGFRQLRPDRWVDQRYLQPTPGSDCG